MALPRQKETEPSRSAVVPDALMHVAMSYMSNSILALFTWRPDP